MTHYNLVFAEVTRRASPAPAPVQPPPDRLINVTEAALTLGVSKHHLYKHPVQYRHLERGRRPLLYSYLAVQRYATKGK